MKKYGKISIYRGEIRFLASEIIFAYIGINMHNELG